MAGSGFSLVCVCVCVCGGGGDGCVCVSQRGHATHPKSSVAATPHEAVLDYNLSWIRDLSQWHMS